MNDDNRNHIDSNENGPDISTIATHAYKKTFTPKDSNFFMFMIIIFGGLVLQIILGLIIGTMQALDPNFEFDPPVWAAILLSQLLIMALPCLIYLIIHRRSIKEILPMRSIGWLNIVMIAGMSLTIQPLFMLVNLISQFVFPNVIAESILGIGQEGGLALTLLIVAVVPSVFEEVAFRGIGFVGFKKVKIWKAAVINGMVFGAIHMNMNQFLYAFLLGAVFCYFMYYTKSLWAPILGHFVVNGTQSLLSFAIMGLDLEAMENAVEMDITLTGGQEMLITIIVFSFIALVATGIFIAIYIPFKRHNIKRNEACGVITDTAAAALAAGEKPPRAFTWAFWASAAIFALLMAANYLLPLIDFDVAAAACAYAEAAL